MYEFAKNKKISGVRLSGDDTIILTFESIEENFLYSSGDCYLYAGGDCCSASWFEILDKNYFYLVGKEIKEIIFERDSLNLPYSKRQEHDRNHKVTIKLNGDNSDFVLALRNSSNGYYDGYLEIEEIK